MKAAVQSGKAEMVTVKEVYGENMPPVQLSDDSKYHMDNWIDCMRKRDPGTNGNIHSGFGHSIGQIMATRAYREGKKLYWDHNREEITDQPVI